jgi:hypothetical protein
VLDRVEDEIVDRLGDRAAVAAEHRIGGVPPQLERAAAERRARPPAPHRRLQQRRRRKRPADDRGRLAVDLPLETLERRRRQLQRLIEAGGLRQLREGMGEDQRLQGAAQLVHRLVQGGSPPAGPKAGGGGDRRQRGGKRPAAGYLRQLRWQRSA